MTKREKVVDDLEEQIAWIRDNDFHKFPGWGHAVLAMRDAIALLKAQEPRVMTVSEIGALANGNVVWVEFTDGRLLPMMVEDGCLMRWSFLWRICEDAFYGEDYKARAWTSRPTDEQREAVKWE